MSIPNLRACAACFLLLVAFAAACQGAEPLLRIEATPDRGIQPRLFNDPDGGVHLLYFRKRTADPRNREGDLYYRSLRKGQWSVPVRVSSRSFAHLDAVGRADLAIDDAGAMHVVWFQSRPEPGYFYTRSDPARTRFEPARTLVQENTAGLDAGAAIAAAGQRVSVAWAAGDLSREKDRTVYAISSSDGGATFGAEAAVGDAALGACACCALAAADSPVSGLQLAYRSAVDNGGRHMQILNADSGEYRPLHPLQQWELYACPVTTNDLQRSEAGTWSVFENRSRIVLDFIGDGAEDDADARTLPMLLGEPLIETRQKNPVIAVDAADRKLVAWGEAISYTRGGALRLRLLDADNQPLPLNLPDITIPDYSFPAAAVLEDGFLILY